MAHALYHSAQTRASYARTRLFGSSFTVCEKLRKLRIWAHFVCERPSIIGKDLIWPTWHMLHLAILVDLSAYTMHRRWVHIRRSSAETRAEDSRQGSIRGAVANGWCVKVRLFSHVVRCVISILSASAVRHLSIMCSWQLCCIRYARTKPANTVCVCRSRTASLPNHALPR